MLGVLADGTGIECVGCAGNCTQETATGTVNCEDCEGQGRVYPVGIDGIEDARELVDLVQLALWIRDRPPLPTEWLDQPGLFYAAFQFLRGHLFGEFDRRRRELKDGD